MNSQIDWTSEQWDQIQQIVADEVSKVSVAGSFLACCGPLEQSATVVRSQTLLEVEPESVEVESEPEEESAPESDRVPGVELTPEDDPVPEPIKVDDVDTLRLWTLSVHIELKQRQLAEENLAGAISAFRRAANLLARSEDAVVFNGLPKTDPTNQQLRNARVPALCRVKGGENANGLVDGTPYNPTSGPTGERLIVNIAGAIATLESSGHLGPFACILGQGAFIEANTPNNSFVLPKDRIEPLLGTQLLRSSTLRDNQVILVSLAGDPIDLVVATSPTVQFLNVSDEAKYRFRVYEKFVLRIKERRAVTAFVLPNLEQAGGEQ